MKKTVTIVFVLLIVAGVFLGCRHSKASASPFKDPPTKAVTVLYDVTDPMAVRPTSEEVVGLFGFSNDNIYDGYELRIRRMSMVNLTAIFDLGVPAQNKLTGDQMQRVAMIKGFRKKVTDHIDSLNKERVTDEPYSVIYRTMAQELNHLSEAKADTKVCVIYSDMIENSQDANFYSAASMAKLRKNPKLVIEHLESIVPLDDLKGIQVDVVFRPRSYAEELRFDGVIGMYRTMLEAKGASVSVGANLITQ